MIAPPNHILGPQQNFSNRQIYCLRKYSLISGTLAMLGIGRAEDDS